MPGRLRGMFTSGLAPGEQSGSDTNITVDNVGLLASAQTFLDPHATVILNACHAGFGAGQYSIAQLIANQLQIRVKAPVAGMFFSVDPNSTATGLTATPIRSARKPIYMIQDGGKPVTTFQPSLSALGIP